MNIIDFLFWIGSAAITTLTYMPIIVFVGLAL